MSKYNFQKLLVFESSGDNRYYQLSEIFDNIEQCFREKDNEIKSLKQKIKELEILVYDLEHRFETHLILS